MGRDKTTEEGGMTERERMLLICYIREHELVPNHEWITDNALDLYYNTLGFKAFVLHNAVMNLFRATKL